MNEVIAWLVYITHGYAQPHRIDEEYLVLWEGYPKEDASWQPGINLTEAAVKFHVLSGMVLFARMIVHLHW